jgi:hypothetical protein
MDQRDNRVHHPALLGHRPSKMAAPDLPICLVRAYDDAPNVPRSRCRPHRSASACDRRTGLLRICALFEQNERRALGNMYLYDSRCHGESCNRPAARAPDRQLSQSEATVGSLPVDEDLDGVRVTPSYSRFGVPHPMRTAGLHNWRLNQDRASVSLPGCGRA